MRTVVAAALGECVHVAGISNFLRLAEAAGWRTVFLGPAVSIEKVLEATPELHEALERLVPQLGAHKIPPTQDELHQLIKSESSMLLVARDPEDPGRDLATALEAANLPPYVEENLADDILGFGLVADEAQHEAVDPHIMARE